MPSINELEVYAQENHVPIMMKTGIKFILELIRNQAYTRILELGTAIGYSAIRMAKLSPQIQIDTLENDPERAQLALDSFEYGVIKLIGSYAAAMGGVDAIIFTAGVGENSASQRMAIASGLEFMGVKMDEDANKVRGEERVISAPDSKVTVLLIPTNEELMIAMDTEMLVG